MQTYLHRVGAALIAGIFGLGGCQAPEEPEIGAVALVGNGADVNVILISSTEMEQLPTNGKLVVRTSNASDVLMFDASLSLDDFGRIDIVCPNGQQMGMTTWLSNLQEDQSIDLSTMVGVGFSVSRDQQHAESVLGSSGAPGSVGPLSEDKYDSCAPGYVCCPTNDSQPCYFTDGAWICPCGPVD